MAHTSSRIASADRRQQIMRVAMALFALQGFEGTTTRQIAERAGVNEAIIFRHFPRKEDLYWAVIDSKCQTAGKREKLAAALHSSENDRVIFASIAEDILRRNTEDSTLSRLLLFTALENHRLSHRFFRTYVAENYEALAAHIRRRIQEKRFRRVDPLLAARGFLGMVIYHFLIQELFGGKHYQKFDRKQVSDVLTDIWLQGMQARAGAPLKPDGRAKRR
ncbi:MAG: TetR/AcrR family transcriptional regulator [Acidobacteriia bacterium]|nr:TetR/AcrR family transcriptional regulator [Terriglobia bacterium]